MTLNRIYFEAKERRCRGIYEKVLQGQEKYRKHVRIFLKVKPY